MRRKTLLGIAVGTYLGATLENSVLAADPSEAKEVITYSRSPSYLLSKLDLENDVVKSIAHAIIKPDYPLEAKIAKAYAFVTRNLTYIPEPEGQDIPKTPLQTLQDKGGDCEDLTLLLIVLLYHNNVETQLVDGTDHIAALAGPVTVEQLKYFLPQDMNRAEMSMYGDPPFLYLEATGGELSYPGWESKDNMKNALVVDIKTKEIISKIGPEPYTIKQEDGSFLTIEERKE